MFSEHDLRELLDFKTKTPSVEYISKTQIHHLGVLMHTSFACAQC